MRKLSVNAGDRKKKKNFHIENKEYDAKNIILRFQRNPLLIMRFKSAFVYRSFDGVGACCSAPVGPEIGKYNW